MARKALFTALPRLLAQARGGAATGSTPPAIDLSDASLAHISLTLSRSYPLFPHTLIATTLVPHTLMTTRPIFTLLVLQTSQHTLSATNPPFICH